MKQGIKSIQELYQHLEEQRENRKDIIADTRSLVVNSADGISTLSVSTGDDILTYPISDISHRQIAERLSIPFKAKEWNYITHNPIDDIPKDKRPKPNYKVKPILEDDQLSILLQKLFEMKESGMAVKNQLFFYLALITGARTGELLALTWNDIDYTNKRITISKDVYKDKKKTLVQNRTKGIEARTVYFDDFCLELLKKHKAFQTEWLRDRKMDNPHLYIFIKRIPRKPYRPEAELPSISSFHHFMQKFLKKNGLPAIDVHGFRRMAASYSINNQVPLTTVQTMLGHKSLSTTMIYLRALNTRRKEGVEALSNTYQQLMDKKPEDKPKDGSKKA